MKKRLSTLAVEKLSPPPLGRLEVHDAEVPGLVLRVSSSGAKSWSLTYRFRGVLRRLTLGQYPGLDLKMARERAREARASIQRGEDPVEGKKIEERERRENGFADLVNLFVERYAKVHQREWKETDRILKREAVPVFGNRPVQDIRRRDLVAMLDAIYARTPYGANQTRAHLSRMFNWLVEVEVLASSPLVGARPRKLGPPRERALADDELSALWTAAGELDYPYGPALKFIILTGLRKGNASWLRYEQVNGDWASFSPEEMKGKRPFRCPLSRAAKSIVDAQPRLGPYVFTATGTHGLSNWSKAQVKLRRRLVELLGRPVERWTIHDLRRTATTGMARLGVPLEVRDRVTDHKTRGVTAQVYTSYRFDTEALDAVQKWVAHVAKLTSGLELVATA